MNESIHSSLSSSVLEQLLAKHAELVHRMAGLPGVFTEDWSREAADDLCSALKLPWCAWFAVRDQGTCAHGCCLAMGAAADPASPAFVSSDDLLLAMTSGAMHKQLAGFIRALAGTPEYLDGGPNARADPAPCRQ